MSTLLAPFPCHARAHTDPKRAREAARLKASLIRKRAEEMRRLADALTEIATSGDTDANMTEAANILLAISSLDL